MNRFSQHSDAKLTARPRSMSPQSIRRTDYKTNLVLITFWQRNEKLREVTVGNLLPDTNVLRRTASHYDWGAIQGITNTTLTVLRCDGQEFRFDITTGKATK